MGGHDHHHGPPKDPYRVPKASEYSKIEAPPLILHQQRLAQHGLKDPWIRNHVWKYDKRYGTKFTRALQLLTTGIPTGFALFLLTLGVENALGIDYHPWHHEHAEGHGHDKHGGSQ
ncbi:NADH dehydrogenase [ubiquinone] 1 beta subcomplex subunit 3 [Chelonus insularis]|uniref:NADH dehydrogenase [ubiquinone] 1 beta subcomplex subunit 3 n=1 Tax=Chelonus insularis TaxID=460826 RepID=UPI001588AA3F|nr:NADH dehydrogenase [ubiquinone] 1 beta subcomplex subunit 3 [Chelonus insularis]XP_034947537.1 NADH dehydrogenase [ubiquinone] 1 beta subcomplex subunit 3 [Chelonus insularis]